MTTTISTTSMPRKLGDAVDRATMYTGKALEFDGVQDYIQLSSDMSAIHTTYFDGKKLFTIAIWYLILSQIIWRMQ